MFEELALEELVLAALVLEALVLEAPALEELVFAALVLSDDGDSLALPEPEEDVLSDDEEDPRLSPLVLPEDADVTPGSSSAGMVTCGSLLPWIVVSATGRMAAKTKDATTPNSAAPRRTPSAFSACARTLIGRFLVVCFRK